MTETRDAGSRLLQGLRLLVVLAAAGAFVAPLASRGGLVAALLGAIGGTLLAQRLAATRLRSWAGLLLFGGLGALGLGGAALMTEYRLFSGLLGPAWTLGLAEPGRWLALAGALVGGLRFCSLRHSGCALLEALLAIGSLALALAAHRDGQFHRPLLLGDWAWNRGIDPAYLLLVVGALAALALVPILLSDTMGRAGRSLLSLALLIFGLLLLINMAGPPRPELAAGGEAGGSGDPQSGSAALPQSVRPPPPRPGGGSGDQMGSARAGGGAGGGSGSGQPGAAGASRPQDWDDETDQEQESNSSNTQDYPVAVVVFHDDYTPKYGYFYFRQVAFSQYNGIKLVKSTKDQTDIDLPLAFPLRRMDIPGIVETTRQHERIRTTVALLSEQHKPLGLVAARQLAPLPNPRRNRFLRVYEVVSVVPTAELDEMMDAPTGDPSWSEAVRDHYLAHPADPRYQVLAEEILESLAPPYRNRPLARALAVKRWLDANVIYTKPRPATGPDPVATFLFGERRGHCTQIAQSAVFLMRVLDVPARAAAGYTVDSAHGNGGSSLLIRGGNAHEWPEIRLRDFGWTILDIAPERTELEAIEPPDPSLQRMLGEMAQGDQGSGPQDEPEEEGAQFEFDPWPWLRLLPWVALAALLLAYAIKLWRRLAWRWAAARDLSRLVYRAGSDRLAEVGWRRAFGESRDAFARRIRAWSPSFGPLTECCVADCLGRSPRHRPREQYRTLLASQSRELRQQIRWWRRLLGLLDPISWMRTR